jgi:hypothetical protein
MDQRDIEEHGKDRGEGWGIGIKELFFYVNLCLCVYVFITYFGIRKLVEEKTICSSVLAELIKVLRTLIH